MKAPDRIVADDSGCYGLPDPEAKMPRFEGSAEYVRADLVAPEAWRMVVDASELKQCPRCEELALEGETVCASCGCDPSDDMTWRYQRWHFDLQSRFDSARGAPISDTEAEHLFESVAKDALSLIRQLLKPSPAPPTEPVPFEYPKHGGRPMTLREIMEAEG